MVAQLAGRNNQPIVFWDFTRIGFTLMILSLILCAVYVYVRYFVMQ